MDERIWVKARSLADRFSEEYDEDVALVLGEGLLEALADLLPLEQETVFAEAADSDEQFAKMQAKAQHPAYLPNNLECPETNGEGYLCCEPVGHEGEHIARGMLDGEQRWPHHPKFLEGEAAYASAPVGTIAGERGTDAELRREKDDWYCGPVAVVPSAFDAMRPVLRWGNPS